MFDNKIVHLNNKKFDVKNLIENREELIRHKKRILKSR